MDSTGEGGGEGREGEGEGEGEGELGIFQLRSEVRTGQFRYRNKDLG